MQRSLFIIDDLSITPIKDDERKDLLELIEDRYGLCSTIIYTQLPMILYSINKKIQGNCFLLNLDNHVN